MDPLVSIIIPCHNAARWLEETLASARGQTWPLKEIIVVDDGSTDGSGTLADNLAGPDMMVVHQPNRGQCAALNAGVAKAQGEFIEYLDADDVLDREKITLQVNRLKQLPPNWIASGAWARFQDSPFEAVFEPEAVWKDFAPVDWLVTSWSGGGMMHGAAWLSPRELCQPQGLGMSP